MDVPVQAPEKQPDEMPAEVFTGRVAAVLQNEGEILEGDTLVYLARIDGNASLVSVHWQVEAEGGAPVWEDLATRERFSLTANAENLAKRYRVALFDAEGTLRAAAALALPELAEPEEELIELEPIEEEPAAPESEEAGPEDVLIEEEAPEDASVEVETADASGTSVTYYVRSWDGTKIVVTSVTEDLTPLPQSSTISAGKYFLDRNVTVNGRVSLEGNTELILGDGFTYDVKGLYIPSGKTLTIYGQLDGTGKIYSHPGNGAAIGGYDGHDNGSIVIHGGTIQATGANHCAGIGSNDDQTTGGITIYGGTVTATGKDSSAGIGGGDPSNSRADNSTISIYGGTVTAAGNSYGAGIGNGGKGSGSTVTIGYTDASAGTVSITGSSFKGTVTAERPFKNDKIVVYTGVQTATDSLGGSALIPWDGETISSWAILRAAILAAPDGTVITLSKELSAASNDAALLVPAGKTIGIPGWRIMAPIAKKPSARRRRTTAARR